MLPLLELAPDPVTLGLRSRLARLAYERTALLQGVTEFLRSDKRVCAAWLFGSLGRGDADELSDIDLFVVVSDDAFATLINERYHFMAQVGEPLLILEAPQNWPPGGVYNMAHYPATDGSLQVDWYWVPRSQAAVPSETRVLFDRVGLPQLATPTHFSYQPVSPRPPAEVATQQLNMFWVMLLITAKYIVRVPNEYVLAPPLESLRQVAAFAGAPGGELPAPEPANATPSERSQFLRQLAAQMVALMPLAAMRGARPPQAMIAAAQRYLDLVEALLPLRLAAVALDQ